MKELKKNLLKVIEKMNQIWVLVFFILFITSLIHLPSAYAADNTKMKISGRIVEDSDPIKGATVVILGTSKGAISETDGSFVLEVEKGKTVQLKISAIGYQPKFVELKAAPSVESQELVVKLEPVVNDLASVSVSSTSKKAGSVNAIYLAQKNASAISDGISADIIRKSPDKNTSDVLKRVSGTSIQDNKFVIIRGLSERYNTALINNSVLPSTEADKRAFDFSLFPASLLDQLTIYKSATPDLPGDFAGGAIKIDTKEFPTSNLSELSLSLGYNSLTTFKDFNKSEPQGKYDFLGFFDNKRAIPENYYQLKNDFIHQSDQTKLDVTKSFPNSYGYSAASKSLPNISVTYTNGNTRFLSDSKKLGYIYSVGYGASRQITQREVHEYLNDRSNPSNNTTVDYNQKYNLNALANITYSYNADNSIAWKNIFNNNFATTAGIRSGITEKPENYKSLLNDARQDGLFNSVLEGKHKINNRLKFDWNGSYSFTYHNEPDERILSLTQQTDNSYAVTLSNENSPSIQNAGRVYSSNKEQIFGVNANVNYLFQLFGQDQLFKAGTANYFRKKDVEVNALGYSILNSTNTNRQQIPSDPNDPYNIFNTQNIDNYFITVANISTNSATYQGQATNIGGYLMLDNKFSEKIKLAWGVRLENYDQKIIRTGATDNSKNNLDILPSAILTYALNSKTNLRLAASQSVNRPDFRELASFGIYDYSTDFTYHGNPDLVRSKNSNVDLRYEFFPKSGEIISASVFYKHFDNPIERVNTGNNSMNYQNADQAKLYGAELEIRKSLDFFKADFFRHLTAYTNLSYSNGSVNLANSTITSVMQGQSPYLINAGINYINSDFSFNILYNRIGQRLEFRGQNDAMNIYEKPRDVIDAQLSQRFFHKKLELKLTVGDLLAQAHVLYIKPDEKSGNKNIGYDKSTDLVTRQYKQGSNTSLSIKYNF